MESGPPLNMLALEAPVAAAPPSLNGSLSTSYSLFDFLAGTLAAPKKFTSGSAAATGWNELKKSSPPKSISSFFAFKDLTAPLVYFLANDIPPDGATAVAAFAAGFLPSCIGAA